MILNTVLPLAALAGGALALIAATGIGGLIGLLIPLFFCVASQGIVGPNAMAAAMAPQGRNAGSAAALIGVLQFGTGAIAGALVGLLNDGTARPMAFIICALMLAALALRLFVLPRVEARE